MLGFAQERRGAAALRPRDASFGGQLPIKSETTGIIQGRQAVPYNRENGLEMAADRAKTDADIVNFLSSFQNLVHGNGEIKPVEFGAVAFVQCDQITKLIEQSATGITRGNGRAAYD
jgi:hypothetical protein